MTLDEMLLENATEFRRLLRDAPLSLIVEIMQRCKAAKERSKGDEQ